MSLLLTPIQASRTLLAALASHDADDFEPLLRPNSFLKILANGRCTTYLTPSEVSEALRKQAGTWSQPTINIQGWDEVEDAVTVSFEVWEKEKEAFSQQTCALTVTLQDAQIETISLYRYPIPEFVI